MLHLFAPNHVQLVSACYPPSSALLTSGPDYRPNAQELSRLTYYASNRPGKVNKLGSELEKRARSECHKAQAGNIRSRASLLITLAIFKALATECRRDISLLSPSLLSTLDITLTSLPSDLEVCARAATVFTAWTTYTDGHLIGADSSVSQSYLSTLRKFSTLSSVESDDYEVRNRTRLIGLAALTGAVNSEALYNTSMHFKTQVSAMTRPIMVTLLQTDLSVLTEQATVVKASPMSPYLAEFRTRPPIERRALSIHVHKDGDKGPSMSDVANACLYALSALLQHSNGAQLGHIMQATFDSLNQLKGWEKIEHCCWFAEKACEWAQYQYRYAVPTRLVERLLESQDAATPTFFHNTLAAMITTVFNSPTPLVNLSTSDIISNLITLILRRVAIDPEDTLLPTLVGCIASLGTHVYYSDQIQDLAGELISRLTAVEVQGAFGKGLGGKSRSQAIRCLLAGLLGLMQAADRHENADCRYVESADEQPKLVIGSIPASPSLSTNADPKPAGRSSRRTRISPEIWQETLSLLCDGDHAVRADYADALVCYLRTEIPKRGDFTDTDGVKRVRPLVEGPIQQAVNVNLLLYGDSATRTLIAMHAYAYILATASCLGLSSSVSSSPSPAQSMNGDVLPVNILPPTPLANSSAVDFTESLDSPRPSQGQGRRSMTLGPRSRKVSVIQRLLEHVPSRISASASASASDYAYILSVLTTVHEELPVRGLLTGIPMLLALDGATNVDSSADAITLHRMKAIKEILSRVWLIIGKVWDCPELIEIAEKAISSMPEPSSLPSFAYAERGVYHPPRKAMDFASDVPVTMNAWSGLNAEVALIAIVSCQNAQEATGLDRQGLLRRFAHKWTPESALNESVERPNQDARRGDGISPLLKISPALMHIENMSLQSLARSTRGVGVTDLREALEGRSGMSNPALVKPPSISTLDHTSVTGGDLSSHRLPPSRSKSRKRPVSSGPGEVRDVLNKLGIGKQNGSSLLKASFPALQKNDQRSGARMPPYKT